MSIAERGAINRSEDPLAKAAVASNGGVDPTNGHFISDYRFAIFTVADRIADGPKGHKLLGAFVDYHSAHRLRFDGTSVFVLR